MSLALPALSLALIFAGESSEPVQPVPEDFPYFENVIQRSYSGPTVIYLGAGWALTARHVGHGEIVSNGAPIPVERHSRHTLMNSDGSPADAVIFELRRGAPLPDLPILPIATRSPKVGEEVLMIGFGRVRDESAATENVEGAREFFVWSGAGEKRWGTNRVAETARWVTQDRYLTRSFTTRFDPPDSEDATAHEASAAVGDSGGAVFAKQDGEWRLAGLITSVGKPNGGRKETSTFGDITFSADLVQYRSELMRWTRPECWNEIDDDGDGKIDFPDDAECESREDRNERPVSEVDWSRPFALASVLGLIFLAIGLASTSRRT